MNSLALTEPEAEQQPLVPAVVFAPGGVRSVLDRIKAEALAVKRDISTPKGRDAVRSLAYKIARSKTTLDTMGKELADAQRKFVDAVNVDRKVIRDELDALQAEIRAPLTRWENAEKERVAAHEQALRLVCAVDGYGEHESSADLEMRLSYLRAYPARDWQEFQDRFEETIGAEIVRTTRLLNRAVMREAEEAEQARLAAEAAELARQEQERIRLEREAAIAAEAAAAAARAAEERAAAEAARVAREAEEQRQAAARRLDEEAAARQRAEQERQAAEARAARLEEEARLAQERAEAERIEAVRQAAEDRRAAAEAAQIAREEAVAAERRRAEAAEAARVAQEARATQAAAQIEAERQANQEHRREVNRGILAALMQLGATEDLAKAIITAAASGTIANLAVEY